MADHYSLNIAMLGHKHIFPREGGIEIVVKELTARMSRRGYKVVCYNRSCGHVSDSTLLDESREHEGAKIVQVWTVEKKGLAAMTSSFSAAIQTARLSADVILSHAEGPAALCGLVKSMGRLHRKKRMIVTVHGGGLIINIKNIWPMAA